MWVLHDDRLIRQGDEDDLPALIRATAPAKITIRCVESGDLKLWQAEGKMSRPGPQRRQRLRIGEEA